MFEKYLTGNTLGITIKRSKTFLPYPTYTDRDIWRSLDKALKSDLISKGEEYIGYAWPTILASQYMDFYKKGDRNGYEMVYTAKRQALRALVLAECVEGKNRFLNNIIDGIWCICEESVWFSPAHAYLSKRQKEKLPDIEEQIIDLYAGETAALLAWTYYLLKDVFNNTSEIIGERIKIEVRRRILDQYLLRDDFWWMGLNTSRRVNNWNPWCNSNCLAAFLLLEDDQQRFDTGLVKILKSLDVFIRTYSADGGCDEGTWYWNRAFGSLFDCLELLYLASDGKINLYKEPLIREMGSYIYRTHISGEYFINFSDGSAKVVLSPALIFRLGTRIQDEKLKALGIYLQKQIPKGEYLNYWESMMRIIPAVLDFEDMKSTQQEPDFTKNIWLPDTELMAARQFKENCKGFYLAAKAGHNAEGHNHNDVGQFLMYYDGKPVIIDVGVETYTAKTFSDQRYEIWTMQSSYHNLPEINSFQQNEGRSFKAMDVEYVADDSIARITMELKNAYPEPAGIISLIRSLKLVRGDKGYVELEDCFKLEKSSEDVILNLMTPCIPINCEEGILLAYNNEFKVLIHIKEKNIVKKFETIEIIDDKLLKIWGDKLYRIRLKTSNEVLKGTFNLKFLVLDYALSINE